jgi:hypothetical protein
MSNVHQLPGKWLPVSVAPAETDLEVCVIDKNGIHALIFPVRKDETKWVDTGTKSLIDIEPTHWRDWRHGADT